MERKNKKQKNTAHYPLSKFRRVLVTSAQRVIYGSAEDCVLCQASSHQLKNPLTHESFADVHKKTSMVLL